MEEEEEDGVMALLEQLEKEMEGEEDKEEEEEEREEEGMHHLSVSSVIREAEETAVDEGAELSELEEELLMEREIKLLYMQDSILEEVCSFILYKST